MSSQEMRLNYKGRTLVFNENTEEWSSNEVGRRKSLAAMKAAIDKLDKEGSKVRMPAIWIDGGFWSRTRHGPRDVTITSLVTVERDGGMEVTEAWVSWKDRSGNNERSKVSISDLISVEERSKVEEWMRLQNIANEAEKTAAKFKSENIKVYTSASIQEAKRKILGKEVE